MNVILEKATFDHIEALEALARSTFTATFGHLYTPENLQSHLVKACSATFFTKEISNGSDIDVARISNNLVGYIKYGAVDLPIDHNKRDREIHRLYIVAERQGQGIGQQLMDMALKDSSMQSAPNLFLGVWENNYRAQAFYSRYGFHPVGEYLYYVGTHADREIIMHRSA